MSGSPFTRTPAVNTEIAAITTEDVGRRFRLLGFVVDHQDESVFILSDETGSIAVSTANPPSLQTFVRIFGSVVISNDGQPMIRAEIIQDFTKLDKQLYKQASKLVSANISGRKS